VAVLPFENLSGDEDQLHLADGTTEALSAALAQVRSINVISRTSVMRFQGVRRPVPEIARDPRGLGDQVGRSDSCHRPVDRCGDGSPSMG
jgi:TolB-like protein